jgi:putative hydrolase of the HAD superfamily
MRALLVDLDDTLLDYSGGVEDSWTTACTSCLNGHGVDAATLVAAVAESRRWFWDDPVRQRRERVNMLLAWQRIVEHALTGLGVTGNDLAATIAREYASRRRDYMRLFPESLACLEALRQRGVALGLVTNGDASQQRDKIERHGLARFFDVMVIEGEFGAGKPDEIVYRHALEALRVAPAEAWMVGDHLEFDVAAPQRLGLRAVWVDRERRGLPPGSAVRPDHIIGSLDELCALGAPSCAG